MPGQHRHKENCSISYLIYKFSAPNFFLFEIWTKYRESASKFGRLTLLKSGSVAVASQQPPPRLNDADLLM